MLRYEPGQYYRTHHDYIGEHENLPCGTRSATFFLYLNDVEAGGETYFPALNMSVYPKAGRAALWYNTVAETGKKDPRTEHEARAVQHVKRSISKLM